MTDCGQSFNTLPFGNPCCLNMGIYTQIAITNISVCPEYANGGVYILEVRYSLQFQQFIIQ